MPATRRGFSSPFRMQIAKLASEAQVWSWEFIPGAPGVRDFYCPAPCMPSPSLRSLFWGCRVGGLRFEIEQAGFKATALPEADNMKEQRARSRWSSSLVSAVRWVA